MKLKLGYPSPNDEFGVLARYQIDHPIDRLESVLSTMELLALQSAVRRLFIAEPIRQYIVAVTRATREHSDIRLGGSTRAALGLQSASQALAACRGRDFVIPDDIKALAIPVLAHRIILKTEARLKGRLEEELLREILDSVPVPAE
jgi:MoxR-like ATPase